MGVHWPYVHHAYFHSRASAEKCGAELTVRGFVVGRVTRPEEARGRTWLLTVGRVTPIAEWRRDRNQVTVLVRSYGGRYNDGYWTRRSHRDPDWPDGDPPST
jgi:hypothetical protein